ncbi:hypothetical protein ABID47_002997 [Paenibacillus favisporus]|uniref:Uncharacterized protein n=1 Tax=Paenibacillus favisporus TaxID=221028 RepID=A0ABV2F3S1_9BACL
MFIVWQSAVVALACILLLRISGRKSIFQMTVENWKRFGRPISRRCLFPSLRRRGTCSEKSLTMPTNR